MKTEDFKKELERAIGESHSELIDNTVSFDYLKELCGDNAELLTVLHKIKECAYKFTEAIIEISRLFGKYETKEISEDEFKEKRDTYLLEQKNQELDMEECMTKFISTLKEMGMDIGWSDKIAKTHTGYEKFALLSVFNELNKSVAKEKEIKD